MSALVQQIQDGFKSTEIGVIPEEWNTKQLKSVFNLKNGFAFKGEYFSDKGPIVLTPGNFKLSGGLYFEQRNTKRYEGIYPKGFEFENGDLVVVMTDLTPDCNLLGKPAFIENEEKVLHNQRIGKISIQSESWDSKFLYYTLLSPVYLSVIKNAATGSTVRHTSPTTILNSWVVEPPKKEQTVIANALSDVDALLTELEKLIAKKQAIKTATMQQLLTGKTRLPQFATYTEGEKQGQPKDTKPSELGEIPADWDVYFLDQLITSTQLGGNYSNSEAESSFPLIKMGNLGRGKIKLDKLEYANEAVSARDRLKFDDVLFNTRNTLELVGKVAIWKDELPEAYFNSNIMRFAFNNNLVSSNSYMNSAMNTKRFVTDLAGIATGTTSVAAIYTRDLLQLKLLVPPKEEQTAIATILSDMDDEIQSLEQRLAKTRQIKQGMMQELLTGRTRLPY